MENKTETTSFGSFGSYTFIEDRNLLPTSSLPISSKSTRASHPSIRGSQIRNIDVRLERSDPYGVLPLGCSLLDDKSRLSRMKGLGGLNCLPDEILSYLISFFDIQSLCRVSSVSKTLYAHSHGGNLQHFRERVMQELESTTDQNFKFETDWKTTLVSLYFKKQKRRKEEEIEYLIEKYKHIPLCVNGVYSDLLFKHFVCANADISETWFNDANLHQIESNKLEPSDFISNFEEKNLPVVIRGAVSNWPALRLWTNTGLIERFSSSNLFHCGGVRLSMEAYLRYMLQTSSHDDRPLYMFERHFVKLGEAEKIQQEFSVPNYFSDDLQKLLEPVGLAPDFRWLIIGPRKSGSTFHKDPNGSSAWNALIRGKKAWIFYPPESVPPGVVIGSDSVESSEIATPASVMEWYIDCFAQHRSRQRKRRNHMSSHEIPRGPLCGIQEPGDIVFVPCGWWHQVLNIEDSVCLTHNFISPRNIHGALQIMKDDPAALSGFPSGRENEIYNVFINALINNRPEVILKDLLVNNAIEEKSVLEPNKKISSFWSSKDSNFEFKF
jgi:hypothetical protein